MSLNSPRIKRLCVITAYDEDRGTEREDLDIPACSLHLNEMCGTETDQISYRTLYLLYGEADLL
jgi:hypothetical protein